MQPAGEYRDRLLAVAMAVAISAAGCGTRYVDLQLPSGTTTPPSVDAGAEAKVDLGPSKCQSLTRADGSPCQICYAPDGTITSDCMTPISGGNADAATGGVPSSACKVMPSMDTRCLLCPPANTTDQPTMVCLACQAPVKTSDSGDYCRTCAWPDVMGQCLQCFTADGTPTLDDCDGLRGKAGG